MSEPSNHRKRRRTRSRSRSPLSKSKKDKDKRSRSRSPTRKSKKDKDKRSRSPSPTRKSKKDKDKRSRSRSPTSKSKKDKDKRSRSPTRKSKKDKDKRSRSPSPTRKSKKDKDKRSRSRSPTSKDKKDKDRRSRSPTSKGKKDKDKRSRSRSPISKDKKDEEKRSRSRSPTSKDQKDKDRRSRNHSSTQSRRSQSRERSSSKTKRQKVLKDKKSKKPIDKDRSRSPRKSHKSQSNERSKSSKSRDIVGSESMEREVKQEPLEPLENKSTSASHVHVESLQSENGNVDSLQIKTETLETTNSSALIANDDEQEAPMHENIEEKSELEKRRERMKLWQEKQKLKQQDTLESNEATPVTLDSPPQVKPASIKIRKGTKSLKSKPFGAWSTTNDDSSRKPILDLSDTMDEKPDSVDVDDGADPLDAFMSSLEGKATKQETFSMPDEFPLRSKKEFATTTTITLEEVVESGTGNAFGSFMQPESIDGDADDRESDGLLDVHSTVPYGGTTPLRIEETESQREAREKREHEEFMKAIRATRPSELVFSMEEEDEEEDNKKTDGALKKEDLGRIYQGIDEDFMGEKTRPTDQRSALELLQDAQKKKEIKPADHAKINYLAIRKKFYIPNKDIQDLTDQQVGEIRNKLEIKIRGKGCPRPIETWTQCGFSRRLLRLLEKREFSHPFAIQCQAIPTVLSGRDVIGIAKTGSGKTLAFLLPMFRHILDQPPLSVGEGPIGLIMAPARELAQQIFLETKKFAKELGMRVTAVYGGSSVSDQIGNLKRGSDIVVCTPGRMIDILTMNAGKVISLQRVTYVVLDEADRMFDMGFEPQITKIMMNIRPDRQTLLFSATFPKSVESLARRILTKPIEITVGARSTASGDITQYVEVRDEGDKYMRLLQLLGVWYEKGNILVFVNTQQACDQLFQDLMRAGYPALSLHGGKDQMDRDYTIDDFKRKIRTLMVATSVAGRGLDVKDLVLVINYHCPNHLEDYVHRVGRTGRAGRKGTAYTFISPDEENYAPDLVSALEMAKQTIPPELETLCNGFKEKVRTGEARYHGSGFRGKGFTFDEDEKTDAQKVADLQKRQYEIEEGIIDATQYEVVDDELQVVEETKDEAPRDGPGKQPSLSSTASTESGPQSAVLKAQQIAQLLDRQYKKKLANTSEKNEEGHFIDELEINDYPQQARWKVTQKETNAIIGELTGAAVITRGSYVPAGRKPNPGERKLYLVIEAATHVAVQEAKRELQRILDETTLQVGLGGGEKYKKYSV